MQKLWKSQRLWEGGNGMATQQHLDILKQGVEIWNQWRQEQFDAFFDLSQTDLRRARLTIADLSHADLSGIKLSGVNLSYVNLSGANLSSAGLSQAPHYSCTYLETGCSSGSWKSDSEAKQS
jgi:hypothetical protein